MAPPYREPFREKAMNAPQSNKLQTVVKEEPVPPAALMLIGFE
jgi:hypothetical protein